MYKQLNAVTEEQRNDYEIDDEGIHLYALDADISFESFEYDEPDEVKAIGRELMAM